MLDEGALKDFVIISDVDEMLIQEYRKRLPEEIITVWEKYGFRYVPLLALGSKETAKNLKKVKVREHIALIAELVGDI